MTKQEAKELAIRKLVWFTAVPFECRNYVDMPSSIYDKIKNLFNLCPLCELFCVENPEDGKHCGGCPLTPPSCNDHSDGALHKNIAILQAWET